MAVKKIQAVTEAANTEPAVTEEVVTEAVVTEGEATEGEVTDGVVTEGEAPKGDVGDGIVTEGDAPKGDVGDGVVTEGEAPRGEVTEGEVTEGEDTNPVVTDPVITDPPVAIGYEKGKLYALPLASVQPDPDQPRKFFDEQALAELSASITSHGVLQPILVRQGADGNFIIVSGERRYQAALKAGLATIPAILTDGEPAEISIIENLLRENLTAIEEAEAIERLRAVHEYELSDLVNILGKPDSTISDILSLNRLPAEVKDDCRNNPKALKSILTLIARQKTQGKMTELYTKYKESGLTYGEVRKAAAKPKTDKPLDLSFVKAFNEKIDSLDLATLDKTQRDNLIHDLGNVRSSAYQIIKTLKAVAVTA